MPTPIDGGPKRLAQLGAELMDHLESALALSDDTKGWRSWISYPSFQHQVARFSELRRQSSRAHVFRISSPSNRLDPPTS